MKLKILTLSSAAILSFAVAAAGQTTPSATPQLQKYSQSFAAKLSTMPPKATTEDAAKSYAKLLEGQRYVWEASNRRRVIAPTGGQNSARLAQDAFREAVELNPWLSEAYTALAELAITIPPGDMDEAVSLSELAIKTNSANFGAHRIQARLITFKSGIGSRNFDPIAADNAIKAWENVAKLDDRNAEAWAFLSELYSRRDRKADQIKALEKWRSSATPLESQFYEQLMGGRGSLSPEQATVKLGEARLKEGRAKEAIEMLSLVVADQPENDAAVDMLREAIESGTPEEAAFAIEALQQASFANPESSVLISLLADTYARLGKFEEAAKVINSATERAGKNKLLAAAYQRQLVSLYRENGKRTEALALVQKLRVASADDYSLARLEATLLTEVGRVDAGVAGYRKFMAAAKVRGASNTASMPTDDFSDLLFISQLYSQGNKNAEAIQAAKDAYLVADDAERKQIARLTMATAQQGSGDHSGAEATLREILKESPNNPIAMNNLGYFLLERGERFAEALGLIKKAVEIDPNNPSYLDSLGWAHFKMGNLVEAEENLKKALRFDPNSATIHEHLGDVYKKQGKADLSRSSWQKALGLATDAGDVTRLKEKLAVK